MGVTGVGWCGAAAAATYSAEIRRTALGVPHIKAADIGSIGYGYGYASAQDNICEIADRILTVSGERARHLGAGAADANIMSDLYHRAAFAKGDVERLLAGPPGSVDTPSPDARAMARGYVAGVNRYLRETGVAKIDDPRCRGAGWVRPLTEIDFWRHMYVGQTVDGLFAPVGSAQPPGSSARQAALPADARLLEEETGLGSNAYGLGREVTKSGRGVLLGNPHYPWTGVNRFYRTHFTIPGKLNVVGVSYVGMPLIRMGHTEHVAWSNTVSTASRYGYFELKLDPADPTRYLYEGRYEPMTRQTFTVAVKDGPPVTRTLYATRYGPVVLSSTFPWTTERAFALRQAPVGLRDVDQYMAVWQARSVRELQKVLAARQSYRFNTTAVDAGGEAFFGDMGMIPNVPEELAKACIVSDVGREAWTRGRRAVLDGSRAACDWRTDADSTAPGMFGARAAPQLFRTDYVTQSNDSYWLTNPEQPLTGYSRVWGDEGTARSLRTRLGLDQVKRRVEGTDGLEGRKFDLAALQKVMFGNRHYGGELTRDELVTACRTSGRAKLQPACEALARWDLKVDLDSRGAHLFHLFAENGGLKFRTPFDPVDPVGTPHTLDSSDPAVLAALEKAVDRLAELKIPLDARLGDVQRDDRGRGELVPIHGGAGGEGVFNVITVAPEQLKPELGWTQIRHGASWVMAVEFTDKGPVSRGLLTYSQSTNSGSKHYADQTRLYSRKQWDDLRFTEAAVATGTVNRQVVSE
ncbi:penicillin acylase family protein [Phenylobacterium sp.]|uniref:penicillin acylase family protein n=1 Tax=Phenylobacterium sp. TaxID=1871053 RepID=UPI002F931BF3